MKKVVLIAALAMFLGACAQMPPPPASDQPDEVISHSAPPRIEHKDGERYRCTYPDKKPLPPGDNRTGPGFAWCVYHAGTQLPPPPPAAECCQVAPTCCTPTVCCQPAPASTPVCCQQVPAPAASTCCQAALAPKSAPKPSAAAPRKPATPAKPAEKTPLTKGEGLCTVVLPPARENVERHGKCEIDEKMGTVTITKTITPPGQPSATTPTPTPDPSTKDEKSSEVPRPVPDTQTTYKEIRPAEPPASATTVPAVFRRIGN